MDIKTVKIIKVSLDAVRELLYESIIENSEEFFDLSENENVSITMEVNFESGSMICVAHAPELLRKEFELKRLSDIMDDTASSFFEGNPYREIETSKLIEEKVIV